MNPNLQTFIYHKWTRIFFRLVLGFVFIYASLHKIAEPAQFAKIIYGYYLFPEYSINLIATVVPFLELFSGLALVFGLYLRGSAFLINIMLFFFIIALSINVARGHEFDCGCFSIGEVGHASAAVQLIFRDIFLLTIGLYVLISEACVLNGCVNGKMKPFRMDTI